MAKPSLTGLLLLVLTVAVAGKVEAHAVLLETTPADGAALARSPEAITLQFNEPVRPIAVRVLSAEREAGVEPADIEAENGEVRLALAGPLAGGTYLVSYRVTSADAHPVSGTFVFSVGAPTTHRPFAASLYGHDVAWQVAAALTRALWYAVLLLAAGVALFLVLMTAPEQTRSALLRAVPWLALAGLASGVLALGVRGGALQGEGALTLLTPGPWRLALGSPVAVSAAVAAVGLAMVGIGARRDGRALLVAGAVLIALSFALSGHAMTTGPRWLMVPAVALHALLAAFWLGALWPLLAVIRRHPPEQAGAVLAAFSRIALPAVVVLALAGGLLALVELESFSDLIGTAYGQRLALKLVLVAGLLALAAINRWLLTPALVAARAGAAPWLRRALRMDLVLGAGVVAMTASLGAVPPPHVLAAGEAQRAAHHDDNAAREEYRVRAVAPGGELLLVAAPARVGANRFELRLMDRAGQPLDALEAELRLSLPEQGVEALRVEARRQGSGRFAAPAVLLPLAGTWQVRADLLVDDFTKLTFRTRIEISG